jgi:hypothetical protein
MQRDEALRKKENKASKAYVASTQVDIIKE